MTKYRSLVVFAALFALMGLGASHASAEEDQITSRDRVLRDPDIISLGNEKGDVTIVEWFDYQCPYCKKLSPDLAKLVKEDGRVRLILKDWPILGDPSPYAAQLVQAAKYQDKYIAAHDALMGRVGRLTEGTIEETLAGAGVDVAQAKSDLQAHKSEIDDLLKRNNDQAEAFGFNSTPSFIVGTFRIPGILTPEQFKLAIADARKLAKKDGAKKDPTKSGAKTKPL
jgi:protein-disulfide isomerase